MDSDNIINNLLDQMAFFHLETGNYVMTVVALVFLYPATGKGFEPLLLIPIAFGMLLISIYPDIMYSPEQISNGTGGPPWYFFQLDEQNILPSPIFLGVGAMTDFGPLVTNPVSFLMDAVVWLGVYSAYFFTILLEFSGRESAAISIIDGTGGPTSLFLCSRLRQTQIIGPTAVATYFYMALVSTIQPPFMKLLIIKKERKTKMEQLHPVSKLKEILFPIVVTIVVCLILPSTTPLVGIPMSGNPLRESDVVRRLAGAASNVLMYIVVIPLDTPAGTTTNMEIFLNATTIKIVALGLIVFIFGTVGGVLLGKSLCKIIGGKISPLTGSAGMSVVPMATHVSQRVGAETDPASFLLMRAMGSSVAGVIGTAITTDTFMAIFGVQWHNILTMAAASSGL